MKRYKKEGLRWICFYNSMARKIEAQKNLVPIISLNLDQMKINGMSDKSTVLSPADILWMEGDI